MEETLFIKQGKHKATGFLFLKPTTGKLKSVIVLLCCSAECVQHLYFEQCYELYVDLLVHSNRVDKLWNFMIRVLQSKKEKKEVCRCVIVS